MEASKTCIKSSFFKIGPKSYLHRKDVIALAKDSGPGVRHDVDVMFTEPYKRSNPLARRAE